MIKNETKDMYLSTTKRINKKMFMHDANEAECKIIADYINDFVKYYGKNSHSLNVVKFTNIQIGDILCRHFTISIDTFVLKFEIQLLNRKHVFFKFHTDGSYNVSGYSAITRIIEDFIISWGIGIMKNIDISLL